MSKNISTGKWAPEGLLEEKLAAGGVPFEREMPVKTGFRVNAGRGRDGVPRTRDQVLFCDFTIHPLKLVIELDGKKWHESPENKERDGRKDQAVRAMGYQILRIPSHEIYKKADELVKGLALNLKNHSGELSTAWVKVGSIKKGVLTRRDHVYAKKYDICLEADEHSFCCETIFIHNSRYIMIPFNHGPGKGEIPASTQPIVDAVKSHVEKMNKALKKENKPGIPWGKIERDANGDALIGKLHHFDVNHSPLKTQQGPGQGWGPVGDVRQGPNERQKVGGGPSGGGTPFLQGVNVYQRQRPDGGVSRSFMTFRVASSKQQGTGMWHHPGLEAADIMEATRAWVMEQVDSIVIPQLMAKLDSL